MKFHFDVPFIDSIAEPFATIAVVLVLMILAGGLCFIAWTVVSRVVAHFSVNQDRYQAELKKTLRADYEGEIFSLPWDAYYYRKPGSFFVRYDGNVEWFFTLAVKLMWYGCVIAVAVGWLIGT